MIKTTIKITIKLKIIYYKIKNNILYFINVFKNTIIKIYY